MNLAEIRKKSELSRQGDSPSDDTVSKEAWSDPVVESQIPDPRSVPEEMPEETDHVATPLKEALPEYEAESVDMDNLIWADDESPDKFNSIDRFTPLPEPEPYFLLDEAPASVMSDLSVPEDNARPDKAPSEGLPYAPIEFEQHASYAPLTILLAGREEAGRDEESVVFSQETIYSKDLEEYLCFRVADEKYAINIMAIKEIIKPREVTEVPRMPDFVTGVISLRGVIIPVMDMRLRLSLPVDEPTGRERVIVLRMDKGFCGVLVDEVIQVVRINSTSIEDPPAVLEGIGREFVMGLGRFDNRMLILLNLDNILNLDMH